MNKKSLFSLILSKSGITAALDKFWGSDRLTVLAYHRIIDVNAPGFDLYRPNVSASPAMFERQMAYVSEHFTVIDLARLNAFIHHGEPLPPRPLLITFDDGYIDNYTNAYPILRRYNLPAIMFLIAGKMDNPTPPWWDLCAYYFNHTRCASVDLPLLGQRDLTISREAVREELMRQLKRLPNEQKNEVINVLGQVLDVPATVYPPLFVSWDQVRELVANGISCQPHTVDHPIMTRIGRDEVLYQLCESRARIERETGQQAITFAYPNGTRADFDDSTLSALRECGYQTAFTLVPGPMKFERVRKTPLTIKRVALLYKDTFDMFLVKLMGVPALLAALE